MFYRRRANSIFSLSVDDTIVEGVEGIRGLVFNHFSSHFQFVAAERPCIENLNFNMLNVGQCGELTKPYFQLRKLSKLYGIVTVLEVLDQMVLIWDLLRIFGRNSVVILCAFYLIFIGMGSCQKASTILLLL